MTATMTEMIAGVRKHAAENYDQGWDVVVEAYEDKELAEAVGRARSIKGAIAKVAEVVEIRNERQAEIDCDHPGQGVPETVEVTCCERTLRVGVHNSATCGGCGEQLSGPEVAKAELVEGILDQLAGLDARTETGYAAGPLTQEPLAQAQAAPEPAPAARIDLGARQVTYYWPTVSIGGETFECGHRAWGHQTEGAAQKCARQLAAQHGAK